MLSNNQSLDGILRKSNITLPTEDVAALSNSRVNLKEVGATNLV